MEDESRVGARREGLERSPERLEALLGLDEHLGIELVGALALGEDVREAHDFWEARVAERVLVEHVVGDGVEVGLGVSDRLVVLNAQESQENLLDEIGDLAAARARAAREEAVELAPVASLDGGEKRLPGLSVQIDPREETLPLIP